MQTKRDSLIESIVNILVGYVLATVSQIIIFRHMGLNVPIHSNLVVSNWLTVVSIVRSYLIRRVFNGRKTRA